jgi:hypothetical protein
MHGRYENLHYFEDYHVTKGFFDREPISKSRSKRLKTKKNNEKKAKRGQQRIRLPEGVSEEKMREKLSDFVFHALGLEPGVYNVGSATAHVKGTPATCYVRVKPTWSSESSKMSTIIVTPEFAVLCETDNWIDLGWHEIGSRFYYKSLSELEAWLRDQVRMPVSPAWKDKLLPIES